MQPHVSHGQSLFGLTSILTLDAQEVIRNAAFGRRISSPLIDSPFPGGLKGSVLFVDNGTFAQNNASFFWDNTTTTLTAVNAQFKGRPWFDVRAYGAKGDNLTDDSTAIQNAINAAYVKGGTVFFSQGIYLCNTGLTITSPGVTLRGIAKGASYIQYVGAGTALTINLANDVDVALYDISITGLGGASTAVSGVDVISAQDVYFENVEIGNFGAGSGLRLDGVNECQYIQCVIHNNSIGVEFEVNVSAAPSNLNNFIGGGILGNATAIKAAAGSHSFNKFDGVNITGTTATPAIKLQSGQNFTFYRCWTEGNLTSAGAVIFEIGTGGSTPINTLFEECHLSDAIAGAGVYWVNNTRGINTVVRRCSSYNSVYGAVMNNAVNSTGAICNNNYLSSGTPDHVDGSAALDINRFGFNTNTPRRIIDALSTTGAQLRLSYTDNTTYTDFTTLTTGQLSIGPTGGTTLFSGSANAETTQIWLISATVGGIGAYGFGMGPTGSEGYVAYRSGQGSSATYGHKWFINNVEVARFMGDGTNGVNTATPKRRWDIADASNPQLRLTQTVNTAYGEFKADSSGNLLIYSTNQVAFGTAALATNATTGFHCIRGGAGPPTGTPASIPTGQLPEYFDTTNLKHYLYTGGAWKKGQVAGVDVIYA
jgi:hypothetical protein